MDSSGDGDSSSRDSVLTVWGAVHSFPSCLSPLGLLMPETNSLLIPGWCVNNKHSLLIVMEAGKSRIKALADSVSGERMFPGS